jgi:tetratricopeptide (TPR) repeat protein
LHLRRKEFPEALKQFDALVKESEGFRPVYLLRAQVHFLRGAGSSQGLTDLTRFLDLERTTPYDPKDPQLLARRGHLLCQLVPKWELARADKVAGLRLARDELEAARRLGHRPADLFDDLGSVAQRLGAWGEACAAYEEALRTAPPALAVKVHTKRGWIYAQSLEPPQYGKARDDFAAALRLDPKHADAHAGLGYVRALEGAPGEAQRAAALALWHGGDDYLILHNVACVYAELSGVERGQARQHQDMAIGLLERAVELCRRAGDGDRVAWNIRGDSSLRVLSPRAGFKKLVAGTGP